MSAILVLGDSIMWGQGLSEDDKISARVRAAWSERRGEAVPVHRFAHSGADIWDDGQSGVIAAVDPTPPRFPAHFAVGVGAIEQTRGCAEDERERDALGEIPNEEPYLLRQIVDARRSLNPAEIELVLVNAGINDTEVYNLVLPGKRTSAVVERARSLGPRVSFALQSIAESFPNARIIVTGYYPVVSRESRVLELMQFAKRVVRAALQEGVRIADDLLRVEQAPRELEAGLARDMTLESFRVPDPLAPLVRDLADRCEAWTLAVHAVLRQSVADLNRTQPRAAFADPAFTPAHAAFASDSLLWAFHSGDPQDPKAGERKAWCTANGVTGFDALIVECASMGHPNPQGARRYADAVIQAARDLGVF